MVTKEHIVLEIQRVAAENGGSPPGRERFTAETGIKPWDWLGRYWTRWGDALKEAGFQPNQLQGRYADDLILGQYVALIQKLGRMPTYAEVRMHSLGKPGSPTHWTLERFGGKAELAAKVIDFCKRHAGHEAVLEMCATVAGQTAKTSRAPKESEENWGYVYLMKSGRHYKVGRTVSTGRREREFQIQLPERPRLIHQIKTDDPVGIEHYWHQRFEDRRVRKEAEFFALTPQDVAAFKRRKFM